MSFKNFRLPPQLSKFNGPAAILVGIFLCVVSILSFLTYNLLADIGSGNYSVFSGLLNIEQGETTPGAEGDPDATPALFESGPIGIPLPDPWDGDTRVTMLIMGIDYRDWIANTGASRTDTMILLTVDPIAKTAGILSIPRDLWANIPGFNPGKINTAHYLGEIYNLPGGGPGLAINTVEQTIGVPIDYYARINFQAFIDFIDLMGGVKLTIPETILVDPLRPDWPNKTLQPGEQVLPGELALAYARARHTEGGDFARAERQQQVVIGIRDRILEFDLLPQLINNAPEIFATLSSGIDTNMPLEDAIRLAVLAMQIEREDINRGVIDESYVTFGRSPDDLAILIPIPDRIRVLRDEIFTSTSSLSPITPGSSQERMQVEGARISILNGTQNPDLGSRTAEYFTSLGANIINIGAAEQAYTQTTIIDYSGAPFGMQFFVDMMGIQPIRIKQQFDPNSLVDIEIKLGTDWLNSNPMP
ncbi:MAG: LytR family transcriptional regulator [Chloroflexi bacterium]|nr:LytR family transcriptional regulator [Chloroflexota bacterium]